MRDPQFDAATLGNSHAVRLAPEALDRETGRRFAMLAVEGTWPDEHMFLMQQFARRHPSPFFVVVLDDEWCSPKVEHGVIVPRWLYDESRLRYASRILSNFALRSAWRRLMVMAGLEKPVRADGYDARPRRPWSDDRMRRIMETMPPNIWGDVEAPYPYFDKLERLLPEFSPSTSILFVFVPVFSKYLPAPNSNADTRLKACKERANTIARTRPRTAMLDLRVDGPKVRDIDNFSDVTHYNEDIARDIEVAIRQRIVEMQRAAPR